MGGIMPVYCVRIRYHHRRKFFGIPDFASLKSVGEGPMHERGLCTSGIRLSLDDLDFVGIGRPKVEFEPPRRRVDMHALIIADRHRPEILGRSTSAHMD